MYNSIHNIGARPSFVVCCFISVFLRTALDSLRARIHGRQWKKLLDRMKSGARNEVRSPVLPTIHIYIYIYIYIHIHTYTYIHYVSGTIYIYIYIHTPSCYTLRSPERRCFLFLRTGRSQNLLLGVRRACKVRKAYGYINQIQLNQMAWTH